MPAAGKTTLGRQLAQELGYAFADLDERVEQAEGMTVPELFAQKGEAYFREAEARELRRLAGQERLVVATGGGTPCFCGNLELMSRSGYTIFLDVPLEKLAERLQMAATANRPLFASAPNPETKLLELWQIREPFYRQANLTINAEKVNARDLATFLRHFTY